MRRQLLSAAHRLLDRLARRRWLTLALVGLLGFLASAALSLRAVPQPGVHDEYSYLLAADTFAAGRLTNPPHPFWQHFESMHIIAQPSYMSKYPPGQGLVLALGQWLSGLPILGVWISVAAACAATCWLFQGWLRPRWALVGGLLTVCWMAATPWGQSYWGGAVAACGGALLYGALPRIVCRKSWPAGLALGLGLAMLMYTRPYEGLVVSVPAAVVLAVWLARLGLRVAAIQFVRVGLPALLVLGLAGTWLGFYHAAVTGSPLRMPYQVHDAAYAACPTFLWQPLGPAPSYRHPEMADYYLGWERPRFERKSVCWGLNSSAATKLWIFLKFYIGAAFLLPLAALWRNCRNRWLWLAAGVCGLEVLAMIPTLYLHPHYVAPIAALMLVQAVAGLRILRGWRWRGRRVGRWLAAAAVAVCVLSYTYPLATAWRHGEDPRAADTSRPGILRNLESDGSRHLVFVRYAPGHSCHTEWVYNRADIDRAKVVWAREVSSADDRRLRAYFADRKVWLLAADAVPPRLLPYDDPRCAAYAKRPRPGVGEEMISARPTTQRGGTH
jgi:hypothetical protein